MGGGAGERAKLQFEKFTFTARYTSTPHSPSLCPPHARLPRTMEQASEKPAQPPPASAIADDKPSRRGDSPRSDKKRKHDNGDHRRGKGKHLHHGSHPNKKRSMGRTEHL